MFHGCTGSSGKEVIVVDPSRAGPHPHRLRNPVFSVDSCLSPSGRGSSHHPAWFTMALGRGGGSSPSDLGSGEQVSS